MVLGPGPGAAAGEQRALAGVEGACPGGVAGVGHLARVAQGGVGGQAGHGERGLGVFSWVPAHHPRGRVALRQRAAEHGRVRGHGH